MTLTEQEAASLRRSEERYRTLFSNMTEGFALGEVICDADGVPRDFRFLEMNEAFERQSGLDCETTRNRPMREVLPHLEQSWIDTYGAVALGAPACRFESHNRDLDRHFSVYCFSPTPGQFAILFTDITARRRVEENLRTALRAADDERRRLAAVLQALPAGVAIAGPGGELLLWNEALVRIWGEPPRPANVDDYRHWRAWWTDTGEPLAPGEWAMARALSRGDTVAGDVIDIERFDGSGRATIINAAAPIRNADGAIVGGVVAQVDITAQRQAERALRESTTLLRAISDRSRDVIFAKDLDGRLRFANPAALALIGKPEALVLGRTDAEFLDDAEAAAAVMDNDRRVMEGGVAVEIEERIPLPDGTERVWLSHKSPYRDADGRVIGLLGVSRDITDRKQAEVALRAANRQLREADRRKDEFIAILSHELRNPMAPIRFALPLLERTPLPEPATRAVGVVKRQVTHLARLVDDLLDASRISRGKLELRQHRVTIESIVMAAIEAAAPAMSAAGHDVRVVLADEPLWVHADPPRMTQVMTNLLNNSAKFTPAGGRIAVEASREGDSAVIRVTDNGIGIPADALPAVFEMFRQVTGPGQAPEGLGIGLALSRQLVELHGGHIEGHSGGVGQGAEFIVRLPLAAQGAVSDRPAHQAPRPGDQPPLKVLVVDDNDDVVEMLTDLVAAAGHDVRQALDGRSAVSAALSYQPDVVLLDLGLPVLSGLEVAREIRRRPETAHARLIAMTGWGQAEDHARTRDAGFDHHLVKPVEPDALIALLAEG